VPKPGQSSIKAQWLFVDAFVDLNPWLF